MILARMVQPLAAANLSSLPGISHGFFSREGGVSTGIYESLNCGAGSDDERDRVLENRARAAQAMGAMPARLVTAHQCHSTTVIKADKPWPAGPGSPEGDAIVTREPGLAAGVLAADCAPMLFAAPEAGVVAAAHAGWRGALAGIAGETIAAMERLGASRPGIHAAIGPCISQANYEVGPEFLDAFVEADAEHGRFFMTPDGGRPHFDLPAFLLARLKAEGIASATRLPVCTYADERRFFSYRRNTHQGLKDYGRQLSAIMVAP